MNAFCIHSFVKTNNAVCVFELKKGIFMNITDFKAALAQFIGTMYYHRLSLFPVSAADGVKYFCEKASAFWLFDDMSAVTVTKAKNEEFIVAGCYIQR